MRILIIADDEHLSIAVEAAQMIIGEERGSSITITDPDQAMELIDVDGYDHVLKNPTLETVLKLIKKWHKLC
jgi:hypothetical protein